MKNAKRLIAGLLAAVMMLSSVTVYAAEADVDEIVEIETEAEEVSEEVQVNDDEDVVAEDSAEEDKAETVETSDNDDMEEVSTKSEDVDNEDTTTTEDIVEDDEDIVDNEEAMEQDLEVEINDIEEVVEYEVDVKAAKSVDYDAAEEYIVKQLLAERKKNPLAAEITIDISSLNMPNASAEDGNKLSALVNSVRSNATHPEIGYFIKSYSRYTEQKIFTRLVFTTYTDIDEATLQKKINEALSKINDNMSDFQKIIVLHDYLAMNCTYDKTTEHCCDLYGALVEGRVKCQGYAHTYMYLLERVGIECYLVRDINETHRWNLVKLDGEYYHVDVTNDETTYANSLKSDTKLPEKYKEYRVFKREGEYLSGFSATSTKYDNAEWRYTKIPMTFEDETEETYTITYVLNGGTNNSENPSSYVKGTEIQFKAPIKDGYEFDGWYLNADFTSKVSGLSKNSSGDKTLYAKWVEIETPSTEEFSSTEETPAEEVYTITYVLNGGTNNSENPATYVKGMAVTFKAPTKDGYEFDGWYLNANFTTKVSALSAYSSGDKTLYAKWTKIETPSTEETSEEEIPSTEETTVEEPSTEEPSSEETTVEEPSSEEPKAEVYTITYVLNGGVNNPENPSTYTKGTAVTFKAPTREGYEFDGWYLNANFTTKVSALSVYGSGDKIIYAKWIKLETPTETPIKTYKVTFNTNGHGTAPAAITVEENNTINRPEDPTAEGYRFDGWYKNAACTKAWNFDTDTVQSNTTLYAKWTYVSTTDFDARNIADVTYTGNACKPEVDVYDDDTLLTAGKDYTVKYYNNVNANVGGVLKNDTFNASLPYVEIIGKGNYTGTVKVNFNILRASIGDENAGITLKVTDSFAASNKAKKPFSSIKYVKAMKENVDFTLQLTDENGKVLPNAVIPGSTSGTFTLEIIGKGNYEGAIERTIYVGASNPTNVKFTANNITVNGVTDKVYTGKALVQNEQLSYGGRQLVNGVDYSVSYTKNVNKGTATMTFKGIERAGFSGSFKKTFKITAADITAANYAANLSASYSKAGAKPAITLTSKEGKRLVNGRDYTLSYTNNKAVGSGTVIVKGKGNYVGTLTVPFSIVKADLNNVTVKTTPIAYNATKAADYEYKPVIKLMDGNTALKAGVDYQIEYQNNTQAAYDACRSGRANTPCAIITAVNGSAYTLDGEIVIPLPIYQNKLTKNNVSVKIDQSECVYTGRQVRPSVEVRFMGNELVEGQDYIVSYGANNVSGKNKGTVTISGIGPNYGGDVAVKFEISRKAIRY